MGIVSRRRYCILVVVVTALLWAVFTSHLWINNNVAIQSGDGPLLVHPNAQAGTYSGADNGGHAQAGTYSGAGNGGHAQAGTNSGAGNGGQASNETVVDLGTEMEQRKAALVKACSNMRTGAQPPYDRLYAREGTQHLIYNKQKRLMYCYLPKVANTNFRRIFLGLEGAVTKDKVPDISGYEVYFVLKNRLKYLPGVKRSERMQMLQDYRKFLVVRDPFERLLSAYRNKFFHPNKDHQAEYLNNYLLFYNKHQSLKQNRTIRTDFSSEPLNFHEFVAYFVDNFDTSTYINEHFVPAYLLCPPCEIHFDYIGKYETINRDTNFIFDKLNIDIPFPGRNDNYSSVATESLAREFYEPLPSALLKRLLSILAPDYTLFGYQIPDWLTRKLL